MTAPNRTFDLVEHALRLHELHVIGIPVCAHSKQIAFRSMGLPPYHVTGARRRLKDVAFQSLTFHLAMSPPDEDDLVSWFSGHGGNFGIVTGYRNLAVFDFDRPAAFHRWAREFPELAGSTPVESTPNGFHVYVTCRQAAECSSIYYRGRKAGHLKALGGYVVSSPSTVPEGRYEWLPGQSMAECRPAPVPDLAALSMHPTGRIRGYYNRWLGRGFYSPDETFAPDD